jgi:hypothetical protein
MAMASAFTLSGQYSAGPAVPPKEWLRDPAACIDAMAGVVGTLIVLLRLNDEEAVCAIDGVKGQIVTRTVTRRITSLR